MKKTLLSLFTLGLFVAGSAQTVIFEENFDSGELPMTWQNIDADGDGFSWSVVQIQDESGAPVFTPLLRSASWNSVMGALTPDNWVITPAIDLTEYAGQTVLLNYDIGAVDSDWDMENYTVYVGTSSDPAELVNSDVFFNEPTLDGVNEPTPRTLDISSLAGETVYVAWRHHDTSDVFTIELDNIQVIAENLSVSDQMTRNVSTMFPNPAKELLNIHLADGFEASKTTIKVTNMAGQNVAEFGYNQVINVNKLPAGVYLVTLTDGNKKETKKLIKK